MFQADALTAAVAAEHRRDLRIEAVRDERAALARRARARTSRIWHR